MEKRWIKKLLKDVKSGTLEVEEALEKLKGFPYHDLGFAKIDTQRNLRKGFPEVILCEGKDIQQIVQIAKKMHENNQKIMATRANFKVYQAIKKVIPQATYYRKARIVAVGEKSEKDDTHIILVVTGGTADISVAEEAKVTAELMGNGVECLYDVGVAGLHRLMDNQQELFAANVLIVVAGMEGALPSVVGGLVEKPVIAVPTSVGYGANFQGLSALLAMLNSCANGIGVVNIDNGFGAGYLASLINQMNRRKDENCLL